MSLKKTEIGPEDVTFSKIKFTECFKQGVEYKTLIHFGTSNFVELATILQNGEEDQIENEVRSQQLKRLNYILYGQFVQSVNMKLYKFMEELDKYKCPHLGNYHIPARDMMDLQMNIREIISEEVECPNIPTSVETAKT